MKSIIYKYARFVLIFLILATVVHAFYQSALPVEKSKEQSDKVGEIIEEIIPPETKPGEFVQKNLRKLAHFTEFFMLGLWTALYVTLYLRHRNAYVSIIPFGMLIALLDETVQIFSERGAAVKDIWIDVLGYVSALFSVLLVLFAVYAVMYAVRRKKERTSV